MLSVISDPIFVFTTKRSNCVAYPFILQASNQPGFATSDFETVWILLLGYPAQPF
jgi:hypothetical protein